MGQALFIDLSTPSINRGDGGLTRKKMVSLGFVNLWDKTSTRCIKADHFLGDNASAWKPAPFFACKTSSIVAVCSTLFAVFRPRIARADSIFSAAQNAMKCIITSAGAGGGATNALLQNLPVILFTSLQLVIFGYFIYTVVQSVSAYGRGEEVTHVVQQPLFTFVFIIIIFVFQSLMFGSSGGCQ